VQKNKRFEMVPVVLVMLWEFRYVGQRGEKHQIGHGGRLPVKEENMAEASA